MSASEDEKRLRAAVKRAAKDPAQLTLEDFLDPEPEPLKAPTGLEPLPRNQYSADSVRPPGWKRRRR